METQSIESGLTIKNKIKVSCNHLDNRVNTIILIVLTLLGVFGTISSFLSMFDIVVIHTYVVLFILIFFGIFTTASILPTKYTTLILIPVALILGYTFYDYYHEFILGFKVVSNYIAKAVYETGTWFKYYEIPNNVYEPTYSTIFIVFCSVLIVFLICFFTLKKLSCIAGFIVTFPFIECGIYFGLVPNYLAIFSLICYWIALLSIELSGYKNTKRSVGFVRVGNSFYAKSDNTFKISSHIGLSSIIMCIVCALLSILIVLGSNYTRSKRADAIRNSVVTAIEDYSFEDAPYLLSRLGNALFPNNGTFNGMLGQKDTITFKGKDKLTITADTTLEGDLYLKGYVGSEYTGQSWDRLSNRLYNNTLFQGFEQNGIYPQDIPYMALYDALPTTTIDIKPNNKHQSMAFIPYLANTLSDYQHVDDTTVKVNDKGEYSFDALTWDNSQAKGIFNGGFETSNISNYDYDTYYAFAQKYYLQLPDNEAMDDVKSILSECLEEAGYTPDVEQNKYIPFSDYYEHLKIVTDYLCNHYEYTLSPGKTPIGTDFVDYFLSENDSGYCSHFASAGVVMLRMLGIPARYVEGYYVPQSEMTLNDDGTTSITVKDNMAHAWAEVYIYKIGWIPWDFTPGYNGNPDKNDASEVQAPEDENSNQDTQTETSEVTTTAPVEPQETEMTTDVTTNVPENPPQDTQPQTPPPTHKDYSNLLRVLKNFLIVAIIIALVIYGIFYRRKYILLHRTEKINGEDYKVSILTCYHYCMELFKYVKMPRNRYTHHTEYAQKVEDSLDYAKGFSKVMDIVLKTELSDLEVLPEDQKLVSEYTIKLAESIYNIQNRPNQLIMKYILCLI